MKDERKRSILNGAVAMAIATLIVKIIGVLYKVPLAYIIGDEGMGYFNTAYSIYAFFYVISSAGIPKAITMLIARTDASENEAEYICRGLLKTFGLIGAILTAVFLALARPISIWVGSSRSLAAMLGIAPSIFLVSLSGVLRGYMNGRSRLAPIALAQLIEAISKLVFGLTLAILGMKLLLPLPAICALAILGITLGSFFSLLYLYLSCFGISHKANEKRITAGSRMVMVVIIQAVPLTLSAVIGALSGILDLGMVINGLRAAGYSEAMANSIYGNYSTLAVPMIGLVSAILMPVSMAILPKLSTLSLESAEFGETLRCGWLITVAASAPISIMFYLYSFEILDILFPSFQSVSGAPALAALSLAAIFLPILTLINTALEAAGKIGYALLSLSAGMLVKIVVSLILIPSANFGILGAAVGNVASYAFSLALSIVFLGKSRKALSPWKSTAILATAVICCVPTYIFIYSVNLARSSTLSMILSAASSMVVYTMVVIPVFFCKHFSALKQHYAQKKQNLKVINP